MIRLTSLLCFALLIATTIEAGRPGRQLQQANRDPNTGTTITVSRDNPVVNAIAITPVIPYPQTGYFCNVSGDSRLPPFGSGVFPLTVRVPVGVAAKVIFANITGTIPGTGAGCVSSVVQQPGTVVQQPGTSSSVVQPGTSSVVQPGTSSVVQPGTSSVVQPGTSSVVQPGTSSVVQPGTSSVVQPGTSSVVQPGTSSVVQPGTSSVVQPGTSSVVQPGTSSVVQPGTSSVVQPGTSSVVQPGTTSSSTSSVVQPGTSSNVSSSVVQPGTSSSASNSSSSVVQPGTSSVVQPGTSSVVQPGTSSVVQPGTSSVVQPGTSSVVQPGTSSVVQPGTASPPSGCSTTPTTVVQQPTTVVQQPGTPGVQGSGKRHLLQDTRPAPVEFISNNGSMGQPALTVLDTVEGVPNIMFNPTSVGQTASFTGALQVAVTTTNDGFGVPFVPYQIDSKLSPNCGLLVKFIGI